VSFRGKLNTIFLLPIDYLFCCETSNVIDSDYVRVAIELRYYCDEGWDIVEMEFKILLDDRSVHQGR
jgi:hypothetical protein